VLLGVVEELETEVIVEDEELEVVGSRIPLYRSA
jgi:hypothetical protein